MNSPLALCDHLNLKPTQAQLAMLVRLGECPKTFDIPCDDSFDHARAAAIFALWRVMNVEGSEAVIIASEKRLLSQFMGFLNTVTMTRAMDLAHVSTWLWWNRLQFGVEAGWGIRGLSCNPYPIRQRAGNSVVSIALGAKSDQDPFLTALRELDAPVKHPKNTFIRLW